MLCVGFWFGCIDCKININKKHHRKLCVKQVPNMLKNFYLFIYFFLKCKKTIFENKIKTCLTNTKSKEGAKHVLYFPLLI